MEQLIIGQLIGFNYTFGFFVQSPPITYYIRIADIRDEDGNVYIIPETNNEFLKFHYRLDYMRNVKKIDFAFKEFSKSKSKYQIFTQQTLF